MNTLMKAMKAPSILTATIGAIIYTSIAATSLSAAEDHDSDRETQFVEREELLRAVERSRLEMEQAAEEAREKAERLRQESEALRAEAAEQAHQSEQARAAVQAELARQREELSRTHQELRRATREVARAHRQLSLAEDRRIRTRTINLGDRAMLGVILGGSTREGVKIIGVSPDGAAERAGIETGDVLISLRGESLAADSDRPPRETIYEILAEVEDGEEISASVLRNDEKWDFMIKPEKREPTSWATAIRLPTAPDAPSEPGYPAIPSEVISELVAPHILVEQLAIPPIDTSQLAAEALVLAEELKDIQIHIQGEDGDESGYSYSLNMDGSDFEFNTEAFSEFGARALEEANLWFGNVASHGIRFTELNEGLAGYFETDSGVLVLDAPEDNAFGLQAGDVVTRVGNSDIEVTADFIRALRDHDSGDEVKVRIRRNKQDLLLDVVIPDNRFGFFDQEFIDHLGQREIITGVIAD